ncbi:MAG: hypothetical protein KAX25_07045 [Dehalococcoidia bacterium]|nr:hypothetical protein [Dehalococcoidia bacterium]
MRALKRYTVLAVIPFVVVLMLHCDRNLPDKQADQILAANCLPQGLVKLPFYQRPNSVARPEQASDYREPLDADSIELFIYRADTIYHPVSLSQRCHIFISTYVATEDLIYLSRAEKYIRKLVSLCHQEDGALYAPYKMLYRVHSDTANTLNPPWYSGMAQGEMLSVLSKLYTFTGNEEYREYAHQIFAAFLRLRDNSVEPWVVRLDQEGFYWIEEYPHDVNPGMTLNGFVTAVFGVYEYYLATGDPKAILVYDLSLTTLKHYLPRYVRNGENSYYCLGHLSPANDGYHQLHIRQMEELHRISGDPFFEIMAETFRSSTAGN